MQPFSWKFQLRYRTSILRIRFCGCFRELLGNSFLRESQRSNSYLINVQCKFLSQSIQLNFTQKIFFLCMCVFSGRLKEITENGGLTYFRFSENVFVIMLLYIDAQDFSGLYPAVICIIGSHHDSIEEAPLIVLS